MARRADHYPEDVYPRVVCPRCGGKHHRINDLYDPNRACRGDMLVYLDYYRENTRWIAFPETEDTVMGRLRCPKCKARYCDWDGRVTLDGPVPPAPPPPEVDDWDELAPVYGYGVESSPDEETAQPEAEPEPKKRGRKPKVKQNGDPSEDILAALFE